MALYSFCVKKKGANDYIRAHMNHELAFLDLLAMQFNNKQELLRFLGVNPDNFEDIAIIYRNNHTNKILPLYFDAPELERIAMKMVDFSNNFMVGESLLGMLSAAYEDPSLVEVSDEVPAIKEVDDVIARVAYDNRPNVAYRASRMNKKALEYYELGRYEMFRNELMRSYIGIRKAYMSLRENNHISGKKIKKYNSNVTMQELIKNYHDAQNKIYELLQIYAILGSLTLTPYEEVLVEKILDGDENSYEELMASDTERLEYLRPLLDYLAERRGKVRKIGTID